MRFRFAIVAAACLAAAVGVALAQDRVLSAGVTRSEWILTQQQLADLRAERDRLAAESVANARLAQREGTRADTAEASLAQMVAAGTRRLAPATPDAPAGQTAASSDPNTLTAALVSVALNPDARVAGAARDLAEGRTAQGFSILESNARSVVENADVAQDARQLARGAAAWREIGALAARTDIPRAIDAYRNAEQADPQDAVAPLALAGLYTVRGDGEAAAQAVERAAANADTIALRFEVLRSRIGVASSRGDTVRAGSLVQELLALARQNASADAGDEALRLLSAALDTASREAQVARRTPEALVLAREATSIDERRLQSAPTEKYRQLYLAIGLGRLAALEYDTGDAASARRNRNRSIEVYERLHRAFADDQFITYALAVGYNNVYVMTARSNAWRDALDAAVRSERLFAEIVSANPTNYAVRYTHVVSLQGLFTANANTRRMAQARDAVLACARAAAAIPSSSSYAAGARQIASQAIDALEEYADNANDSASASVAEQAWRILRTTP